MTKIDTNEHIDHRGAQLLDCPHKYQIDGITRQSVAGNCGARYPFALENFEAHPNSAREDNIGRDSISDDQSQNGWQLAVWSKSEDKHDQPDNKDEEF